MGGSILASRKYRSTRIGWAYSTRHDALPLTVQSCFGTFCSRFWGPTLTRILAISQSPPSVTPPGQVGHFKECFAPFMAVGDLALCDPRQVGGFRACLDGMPAEGHFVRGATLPLPCPEELDG